MTSLLCDISIWSLREDDRGLLVRDTDFSCFKYYDKNQHKTQAERPYAQVGGSNHFTVISLFKEMRQIYYT